MDAKHVTCFCCCYYYYYSYNHHHYYFMRLSGKMRYNTIQDIRGTYVLHVGFVSNSNLQPLSFPIEKNMHLKKTKNKKKPWCNKAVLCVLQHHITVYWRWNLPQMPCRICPRWPEKYLIFVLVVAFLF